jgi:hypothetical protein
LIALTSPLVIGVLQEVVFDDQPTGGVMTSTTAAYVLIILLAGGSPAHVVGSFADRAACLEAQKNAVAAEGSGPSVPWTLLCVERGER